MPEEEKIEEVPPQPDAAAAEEVGDALEE